ncbi:MAG: serine protease [Phenylobacterium sp.]|uniref:S1C family serine protease n=1 Tax=Phenylobacterium sp. TaxID=1871053 RepID=UPI0012087C74|nr:S1C family serine protease [Phenylobacterium sp.]TAJ67943.1 MAG: serine protease [Phenylobacterium sp.]
MKWLQVGAACMALSAASYASAAAPEDVLGQPVAKPSGKPGGRAAPKVRFGGGAARAYGQALGGLQPEGRSVTRGAKETQVYQQASPSVVLIVTREGLGSGVLVGADGRIVTNLHVVGDYAEVGVVFKPKVEGAAIADADVKTAKVLRRDEVADLALIQVSEVPAYAKPLAIAPKATVEVGADVHAIGHPTGQAWTYTRGIVSQIRRDYAWDTKSRLQHKATVIQTQTPINPGNSGGPLIDDGLQVIGINSFKGQGEGMNFAVSAEDVNAFLARKDDRVTTTATTRPACEAKTLEERPLTRTKGVSYIVDEDCDGAADYEVMEPADKREPITLVYDEDGDGRIDTLVMDLDRNGNADAALYDTDGDGKIDLRGDYRDGEDAPYRYVRVKG